MNDLKRRSKMSFLNKATVSFQEKVLDKEILDDQTRNKKTEILHKLSFPIVLSEIIHLADKKNQIDIQVLKKGKFKHPWWGVLNFDDSFFSSIIRNFEAGIPQEEIAFDFKHDSEGGAAAWVKNLHKNNGDLMASIELTKRGLTSIKDREFKYFSAEYTDDYVEYELSDGKDENGNIVTRETKISHGPTMLGGGLTNRPFIKGMKPVSLSETGELIELEEVIEDTDPVNSKKSREVKGNMEKKLEDLVREKEELEAKIKKLEEDNNKEAKDEIAKVVIQLAEITSSIEKAKVEDEKNKESVAKKLEEKDKVIGEQDGQIKKLSDDVKSLTDTVKNLIKHKDELEKKKYQSKVKETLRELKDKGAFPATIKVAESILLSETSKDVIIKLSEKDGDKVKEVTKSLSDILLEVIESIPKEYRFTDSEESQSVTTPTGNLKELTEADVQKYADEHKLSYEGALIELSKEGKID